MANINKVSREAQDAFAARSHKNAASAQASGVLAEEISPVSNPQGKVVSQDGLIRGDSNASKMSSLRTVFRKAEQGGRGAAKA